MFDQVKAAVTVNGCLGSAGGVMTKEVYGISYTLYVRWMRRLTWIQFPGSNHLPCHRVEA